MNDISGIELLIDHMDATAVAVDLLETSRPRVAQPERATRWDLTGATGRNRVAD